jgi:MoxR-like ATPase
VPLSENEVGTAHDLVKRLLDRLEQVIRGKRRVLEFVVTGLVGGGHILIEDVPGLGKTTLAKTLAQLISSDSSSGSLVFKRIQFTPDLLPYDITGVDIYNAQSRRFQFTPGPVFANILLADEINRTTPKVQSALLEVMAENQVTVGNTTHRLDSFFFVIATQNPIEVEGTYPLPISQIDRFLMKLRIGYPEEEIEVGIVRDDPALKILPNMDPLCSKGDILKLRETSERVFCDERLIRCAVSVSKTTRKHRGVELGASPRGSLMLIAAARAYALIKGRGFVIDQDLVDLAPRVIAHRLKMKDIRLDPESLVREVILAELSKLDY